MKSLLFLLLAATMMLTACGGGSSSVTPVPLTLSGNWQFTMEQQTDGNPGDPVFRGGLQGGFLLQNGGSATGTTTYSLTSSASSTACNPEPSATITGTLTGQQVTLTAVAGNETFSLTGTLSLDSMSMGGTYTSVAGLLPDGSSCGYSESTTNSPQWYATLVPPLTGPIQGGFHSTNVGASLLNEQDFLVSGALSQGANTGASAPITGNLSFANPLTTLSDYPCLTSTAVTGTISGSSVVLQIVGTDGSTLGKIGDSSAGLSPVTLGLAQGGYILQGVTPSYLVSTSTCQGGLNVAPPPDPNPPGDYGNICLGLGSSIPCQQPITLTPSALTFPSQTVTSPPTTQPITLTNTTSSALGGLMLTLAETDQLGTVSFTETDTCGPNGSPAGTSPFSLGGPGNPSSCTVTVSFSPQIACTGAPECLTATLYVNSPSNDTIYSVPIVGTGTGLSASAASTHQLDFGAEGVSETSPLQLLPVTNRHPVQSLRGSSQSHFQDAEHHAEID